MEGIILALVGRLSMAAGDWAAAARVLEDGLAACAGPAQAWAGRLLHGALADLEIQEGRPDAAKDRLLPLLDRPDQEETLVNPLLVTLAWAHLEAGEVAQASAKIADALRRLRRDGDRFDLVDALRVQALVAMRQGQGDVAERALEEGLEMTRGMPYPYAEGRLLHVYGQMQAARGQAEQARQRLETALALFHRLGARPNSAQAERDLAHLV